MALGEAASRAGWQAKVIQRWLSRLRSSKKYQPLQMMWEPEQHFCNERVLLQWLRMSITLAGIAVGLFSFAANVTAIDLPKFPPAFPIIRAHHLPVLPPPEPVINHAKELLCILTGFILLALAILMSAYGLWVFVWRGSKIRVFAPHRHDDTAGCLIVTMAVVLSFTGLFMGNLYDLVNMIRT